VHDTVDGDVDRLRWGRWIRVVDRWLAVVRSRVGELFVRLVRFGGDRLLRIGGVRRYVVARIGSILVRRFVARACGCVVRRRRLGLRVMGVVAGRLVGRFRWANIVHVVPRTRRAPGAPQNEPE
jgi:hypothetical protein